MQKIPDELRSLFDDSEILEIESNKNKLRLSESTEFDPIELAVAWAWKVRKIDLDRALPWSDRSVWNEHDLAGALFWRDHLRNGLSQLRPSLKARLEQFVAEADERFRSITIEDSGERMAGIAGVDVADRSWWWHRVPRSGPIAEDLSRYTDAADRGTS
jgi:hypothetical protein